MSAPKGHACYFVNEGRSVKYTPEFIENEAKAFLEWMKLPTSLYFKRFAIDRGYSPQRMNEFAEVNETFSEVFRFAKEWQEVRVSEGAMTQELNAGFSKFFMANVCNWREKTETTLSGNSQNPLSFVLGMDNPQAKELIPMVEEQQVEYKTNSNECSSTE